MPNWLSYTWTVIINLITLFVIIAIYDSFYDNFEILAISLLILIYLSMQSLALGYGQSSMATALALDTEFKHIRSLLGEEMNEYEKENLQKVKIISAKTTIKMYINAAFISLFYLIALFNIFSIL